MLKGFNFFAVVFSILILSGCSSSLFKDKLGDLDPLKGNGAIDAACFGLDLSSEILTVPTARGLIKCLNSNGSIQEYADLIQSFSDGQLQTVLDVTNENLISNHERLRDLDVSLDQLDTLGVLDRALTQSADLMENQSLIVSALKIFHEGTSQTVNGSEQLDPDLIHLIQILSQDFSGADSVRNLNRVFEMGMTTSSLKSYGEIVQGLNSSKSFLFSDRGLQFLTEMGLNYIKNKISSNQVLGRLVLWGISDGSLLKALDYYNYSYCENTVSGECARRQPPLGIDEQVENLERLMKILNYTDRDDVLKSMVSLFGALDGPISCMGGTKEVPNAALFVMDEMEKNAPIDVPNWVTRDNLFKILLSNSMCSFPNGADGESFNTLISVLRGLSKHVDEISWSEKVYGRPMITMANMLRVFDRADSYALSDEAREDLKDFLKTNPESLRFRRFMISWMGDKTNTNVYTNLSHILAELGNDQRKILGNAMYLMNYPAPDSVDRSDIQRVVHAILKKRDGFIAGNSSYDVLSRSLLKLNSNSLYELFLGVSTFIDSPKQYLGPLSKESRNALLANNAHPMMDLVFAVANNAEKNKNFFNTLYDISYKPQLVNAIRLTGKMARNGSLKDLMKGIFKMFRGTTGRLPGGPTLQPVPDLSPIVASRDLSVSIRGAWKPANATWPADLAKDNACDRLNLDLPFSKADAVGWSAQIKNLASCVNANQQNSELEALLNYSVDQKIRGEQSFLSFCVDWLASVIPDTPGIAKKAYDEFSDILTDGSKFSDMLFMNNLLPFLFDKTYCPEYSDDAGYQCPSNLAPVGIFQAFFRAAFYAKNDLFSLGKVFGFLSPIVQNNTIHTLLKYLHDISIVSDNTKDQFKPDIKPTLDSFPINANPPNNLLRANLDTAIALYEHKTPTEQYRAEKIFAFFRQTLHAENQKYVDGEGKSRIGFQNSAQIKKYLYPLFKDLSVDSTLEWFTTFFYFFDHSPYTPEWWVDWMQRLSVNVYAVPYYYPGQVPGKTIPTVRLISELDILELLVVDGDFSLRDVGMEGSGFLFKDVDENTSIKYLTLIGQSGDDLTDVMGKMKAELDFFTSIMNRTPFLFNDESKRRLTNMGTIMPYFLKLNRMHEFDGSDGKKVIVNDIWLLRDLFKSVLSATPKELRNKYYRSTNSLRVVCDLVKMGFLKIYGQNFWRLENGVMVTNNMLPVVNMLYRASVIVGDSNRTLNPNVIRILSYLIREDCDKQAPNQLCVNYFDPSNIFFEKRFRTVSKIVDFLFDWTKDDNKKEDQGLVRNVDIMKRMGYDLLDMVNRMDDDSGTMLRNSIISSVPFVATDKGSAFIRDQFDLVKNILTDKEWAVFSDLLLDSQENQPANFLKLKDLVAGVLVDLSKNHADISASSLNILDAMSQDPDKSFRSGINTLRWMTDDPDYLALKPNFQKITKRVIDWVADDGVNNQLRPRLQAKIGESLTNGDFLDVTQFIGRESGAPNKDRLFNQLKFVGRQDTIKKLNDFLVEMKAGLVDLFTPRRFSGQRLN